MGIFSKKREIDLNNVIDRPTPPEERRIAMLMQIATSWSTSKPEVSLEIMDGIDSHPMLARTRGWCYATMDDLESSLKSFEEGFAQGDIRCGVYAHRLLREHTNDVEKFEAMERALVPYFKKVDNDLLLAQAFLSLTKGDYVGAFTNYTNFVSGDTNYQAGAISGIFTAYKALIEDILTKTVSNREDVSDEDTEAWMDAMDNFFSDEIKTSEGEGLGWNNFFFVAFMAGSLERELKAGFYDSASVLPELNTLYQEMIEMIDPPIHPETLSVDEVARILLIAIDKGNIFSLINDAPIFFEENNLSQKPLKKYQDEFKAWGFTKFLEA